MSLYPDGVGPSLASRLISVGRRVTGVLGGVAMVTTAWADAGPMEQAFHPRSGAGAEKLFTQLDALAQGLAVQNAYDDPRMWGALYHEYTVGAIGTGVTVADFDGDGLPDLYVVIKTGGGRLFRNLGEMRFEDVTDAAGVGLPTDGAWSQGATFADVDNDGWWDLYVCRFNAPNWFFHNRGDGTFVEQAAARGLDLVDACGMAAFAGYDRDGDLDLYVQTNLGNYTARPQGQPDHLLRNDGRGNFVEVSATAGIGGDTQGHSAVWWDYDTDDWPDLYVANDFAVPDRLYRNNHDGTFTDVAATVLPHTPFTAMGSDLGDVNNDGRVDLLVADMAARSREKDQRGMAESRARNREMAIGRDEVLQFQSSALYLPTGTGRCLEAAELAGLAATDWTWSVRFEDFDNDGWLDLFVTNGMNREQHNADLVQRTMRAESPAARVRLMRDSPEFAERNLAFQNLGNLNFAEVGAIWGLADQGVSFGAATADFDQDGDLDLVVCNFNRGIGLWRNDSQDGHRLQVELRGSRSNRFGIGATVVIETPAGTQVRPLTLARGYLSTSEPVAHFGLGAIDRVERLRVRWPSGSEQVIESPQIDRRWLICEPEEETGRDHASPPASRLATQPWFHESSTTRGLAVSLPAAPIDETTEQPLLPERFNREGPTLAVGDIDGDGRDDLVVGGNPRQTIQLLQAQADGGFVPSRATLPDGAPVLNSGPMLLQDFNGDGCNDLLVSQGGVGKWAGAPDYQPRLWWGNGRGGWTAAAPATLPAYRECVGALAAADIDQDGDLDLFVGGRVVPGFYPLPPRSAVWRNDGGRFTDVTSIFASGLEERGMITGAVFVDVDGDGWSDLVVAMDWGSVCYYRNQAGQGFSDESVPAGFDTAGTGWWRALAVGDFNGDGRPDFGLGNRGLNTRYTASPASPARLYALEDVNTGTVVPLEAVNEGGRWFPRVARSELLRSFPLVARSCPSGDRYASATLGELVGADRLAQAEHWDVEESRSGVLLSQPEGGYRFAPFPRRAQISAAQGIAVADFDGDGREDVMLGPNSLSQAPSAGPFDGGLGWLLHGLGAGEFEAVDIVESGFEVPGEARAIVLLDGNSDARPEVLVSRHGRAALAFANIHTQAERRLAIRLIAGRSATVVAGSTVDLEFSDGSRQRRWVNAATVRGGQGTAVQFWGWSMGQQPVALHVRWPNGQVTRQSLDLDGKRPMRFEITAP